MWSSSIKMGNSMWDNCRDIFLDSQEFIHWRMVPITGSALFFSLIPEALTDDEFQEYRYLKYKNDGYSVLDKQNRPLIFLCDNLYRQIRRSRPADRCRYTPLYSGYRQSTSADSIKSEQGLFTKRCVIWHLPVSLTTPSAVSTALLFPSIDDFQKF